MSPRLVISFIGIPEFVGIYTGYVIVKFSYMYGVW